MVASGRGPSDADITHIARAVREVHDVLPDAEICACLGLLEQRQADELKHAGVFAYNHNLNTSEAHYGEICTTHDYADRVATVGVVKESGLSPCCGALFGMGETDDDIVEVAQSLRALGVDSIPVNFLIPIPGTPLAGRWELTPSRCLKILSLMRLTNPESELRIAGGREHHLKSLQPMGLLVANSIFIGDYLTAKGQRPEDDVAMIRDLGFEILAHQMTLVSRGIGDCRGGAEVARRTAWSADVMRARTARRCPYRRKPIGGAYPSAFASCPDGYRATVSRANLRAMRLPTAFILSLALIAASASACGSSSSKPTTPVTTTSPSAPPTSPSRTATRPAGGSPTPEAATSTGNSEEVAGIVGNVNTSTRTIQIDRRSGASVTKISVLPATTIRSAAGATLTLSGIRTSDRIVAKGSLNDRQDTLFATEITVSQAVPGAAPGG